MNCSLSHFRDSRMIEDLSEMEKFEKNEINSDTFCLSLLICTLIQQALTNIL